MPAQGLYWCQPSATMSFFGNISGSPKLLQLSRLEPLEVIRWSEIWHCFTLKCWIVSIWWRQNSSYRLESSCHNDKQVVTEIRISEHRAEGQRADMVSKWMTQGPNPAVGLLVMSLWNNPTPPWAISLNYDMMLRASCFQPDGRSWSCGPESHEPGGCPGDSCCLFLISAGLIPQFLLRRNNITFVVSKKNFFF